MGGLINIVESAICSKRIANGEGEGEVIEIGNKVVSFLRDKKFQFIYLYSKWKLN